MVVVVMVMMVVMLTFGGSIHVPKCQSPYDRSATDHTRRTSMRDDSSAVGHTKSAAADATRAH